MKRAGWCSKWRGLWLALAAALSLAAVKTRPPLRSPKGAQTFPTSGRTALRLTLPRAVVPPKQTNDLVTFSWTADLDPLVTRYMVLAGQSSGIYSTNFMVTNSLAVTLLLPHSTRTYLAVVAYDENGRPSPRSNEAKWPQDRVYQFSGTHLGMSFGIRPASWVQVSSPYTITNLWRGPVLINRFFRSYDPQGPAVTNWGQ